MTFDVSAFAGPDRLGQFGEEKDVLTDNISGNAGPGGSTFRTDNIAGTSGPGGSTYRTDNISSTAGPGGSTFRTGEDDNLVIHPEFQPEADGVIQRGDIYQDKAQLMQHAPKESEYRPESQVNPVGVGYTEVEWTYFADNICTNSGPGGTSFRTEDFSGFPYDTQGLYLSAFDVMNNIGGSASPGGDDV